jgi:sirohydrochlorin cobaltochelatase
MNGKILAAMECLLAEGRRQIGEILILVKKGNFTLLHHADKELAGSLQEFNAPEDALQISTYDDHGEYRPLKTAPNLRHGWELHLRSITDLCEALDYFYPAMLGVLLARREERVSPVHFRQTAERQSGMYDVVKMISNKQADVLVGDFCRSDGKCLKTILWKLDSATALTKLPMNKFCEDAAQTTPSDKSIPLLCVEACNLLVAAARSVVRKPASAEDYMRGVRDAAAPCLASNPGKGK